MTVGVLDNDHKLDPAAAIGIDEADLAALAGKPALPPGERDELIYVPRIPHDRTEAEAMLGMIIITTDLTVNPPTLRAYAGYTQDELRRGKPAVIVS
jgi:hypothetical protein